MTNLERLASAIILFYRYQWWTAETRAQWKELTNSDEITTFTLVNLAKEMIKEPKQELVPVASGPCPECANVEYCISVGICSNHWRKLEPTKDAK